MYMGIFNFFIVIPEIIAVADLRSDLTHALRRRKSEHAALLRDARWRLPASSPRRSSASSMTV